MNYDVWDKVNSRIRPPPPQAQGARAATQPQAPVQQPPPWAKDAAMRMPQARGGQYETGDPSVDAFLRERALRDGQPMEQDDDAYSEGYENPQEFQRLINGAYQAGRSGDRGAMQSFPNTPIGDLMRRAYQDGARERGGR